MLTKSELATGIRFAGERAAAAAESTADWDVVLGNGWTTHQTFSHVAATAGGAEGIFPLLDTDVLNGMGVDAVAGGNAQSIEGKKSDSKEQIIQAIRDGHEASAKFVEGCDDADLAKVVSLGDYTMTKGEIVGQIWINHAIAHSYEASARWPLA